LQRQQQQLDERYAQREGSNLQHVNQQDENRKHSRRHRRVSKFRPAAPFPTSLSALASRLSFYLFLIVFYVGWKGLSQLFASYLSNGPRQFKAPIYLTTCEYALWTILGSIHTFTKEPETEAAEIREQELEKEEEEEEEEEKHEHGQNNNNNNNNNNRSSMRRQSLSRDILTERYTTFDPNPSLQMPLLTQATDLLTLKQQPKTEEEEQQIDAAMSANFSPSSTPSDETSLRSASPSPRPRSPSGEIAIELQNISSNAGHEDTLLEGSVPSSAETAGPLTSEARLRIPAESAALTKLASPPLRHADLRPPAIWPSWRVTFGYLSGELVKTVFEVLTVVHVEMSLALVLLATAPFFSVIFRAIFERKRPTLNEIVIIIIVLIGLLMRIPDIQDADFLAVLGGLVSAASAAWISSFKSLIFDPPRAPHVLDYMTRFGPVLMLCSLILSLIKEMDELKARFDGLEATTDTFAVGFLFAMLAAPASVVSKRLQRLLGSFQRTLLSVLNNVIVAFVSIAVASSVGASSTVSVASILGSIFVFCSPAVNFIDLSRLGELIAGVGRIVVKNAEKCGRKGS
jgi:hypothetical protein